MKQVLFFTAFLIGVSCSKNKNINPPKCEKTCTTSICPDIFYSCKVKIKNADGTPYKLDSFKTFRIEDNKLLDPTKMYIEPGSFEMGEYPVFSDIFKSMTDLCGKEFRFVGYKNNIELINEKYFFSHDCCNMQRLSGKTELIIY